MEKQALQLVYDGDALKNHEIEAYDLSRALIGISSLFQEANREINNDKTTVKINIKANFKEGSFGIDFDVAYSFFTGLKHIFNSEYVGAILNASDIFKLLFGSGVAGCVGVVQLIKHLKGKKLTKENIQKQDDSIIIKIDDEQFRTIQKVLDLYDNQKIRKALEDMASPVKKEGIDKAFIKHGKEFTDIVDKDSISYFDCPPITKIDMDNTNKYETQVSIVTLSFTKNIKWRFNDGQSSFNARIEDELFWKDIQFSKVNFSKDDILKVLIRREQYLMEETNKLKINHYIEKILQHKKSKKEVEPEFDF